MHTMPDHDTVVTVGVDTHGDQHTAVAIDQLGQLLGSLQIETTRAGYGELVSWASHFGTLDRFGVEGTGSFGAGLARWLRGQGLMVVEVDRPDRKARRRGKSDLIDAEAAARAVQAGTATTIPKRADGNVEMIRVLRVARRSAVKAQTQAGNQLRGLLVTAPDDLRDAFRGMTTRQRVPKAARLRPGPVSNVTAATKLALRQLAQRWLTLDAEIKQLDAELKRLVTVTAPNLVAQRGISTHTAATLLVTAGDNPHRLRSEGSFAHLTGTAPLDASSGKQRRHRLNRGGDRDANCALHMIAINRLSHDPRSHAYVNARTTDGKADPDILRRLKRYIAREVYKLLIEAYGTPAAAA
jgi:transposase